MKIDHILKLARLKIEKREKETLEKDFSSILEFIKKLEELDVSGTKPMNYPTDIYNKTRKDEIIKKDKKTAEKLVEMAPNKKENYIKTKEVLS